ncbi:ArnT family glycosyltransferase [Tunturiibacter lichenicola]|uniref:ArnT family glycosyltransferase n=1 Tax=Tunturiibacter lichenicola TaxID=2051959 RepID=UPI0021B2663D|nr:glycosyltransferase family 39 protein [Edaphobacter lichenicola]
MPEASPQHASPRLWSPRSLVILIVTWLVLQVGGLFTPGLLDDVDSVYIEIAREMLRRHDFVTPYINGIRFFDKPPLMYWMAAGSMHLFGVHDWAARLPLALAVLALLLATYALGIRLFAAISPASSPDRGGFYASLAMATSVGPYLYTRFYIPDILLALWMTLAVHLFLIALDRIKPQNVDSQNVHFPEDGNIRPSAILPCLAFAAVMAANVLTKGLIGLVFPIGFVFLYLALTKQLRLLFKLHLLPSALVFLALAAPWHILAALRTPAIALPQGLGLPATGGWAWFYLYNEHIARFLSRRIPHDYGLTPVWLFWLYLAIWIMPWTVFLPGAIRDQIHTLRNRAHATARQHEAALALVLWALLVLGFFTLSNRQEYYSLPALPALALMAGGLLASADRTQTNKPTLTANKSALNWHLYALIPLTTVAAIICGYFAITAPHPPPGTDIVSFLAIAGGPEVYNLSLSHITDLTGAAMGFFRGPLAFTAIGMLSLGLGSYLLRRAKHTYAANLTLAASMALILLAAHEGLVRFYPILGSKSLALAINEAQRVYPQPDDLIIIDGELTSGSTLIFYTSQQVHLINGRGNGLWYGSFWPDSPQIFETEQSLHQLWASRRRIFLFTYNPAARTRDLSLYAATHTLATAGGKTVLTNR